MILGIDIGGTNIGLGLVEDGHVIRSVSVPSFPSDFSQEQTIEYLKYQIDAIMTTEVKGIGFGVPSVVDVENGIVYDTANIPSWQEIHLKSIFENIYGCPVAVNNDSNCYALGAYASMFASPKPDSMVAITLGTGVGMGLVIDGKLSCGAHCGVGELACLPYKDGTIEDYTSKKFFLNAGTNPKQAGEAAGSGDPKAQALFDEFGEHMGYAISTVLYAYDPRTIVLGGGVANNYPYFRETMLGYLKKNFPYHKTIEDLDIVIATDNFIPVIGAATLI